MTRYLAFDFETHTMGDTPPCVCGTTEPHSQFPPAVCMSWARADSIGKRTGEGVCKPSEGIQMLREALRDPECIIIGAETAFDCLVSCVNADDFDAMLTLWVAAYEGNGTLGPRVHDVLIRQKMIDLAAGTYRWRHFSDGKSLRIGYNLATVAKLTCGLHLDKSADTWRLRYALLEHLPIAEWPAEAYDYALLDSTATLDVFFEQENWRESAEGCDIAYIWAGREGVAFDGELDPLHDATAQTKHALWLKAMSGEGLVIDGDALDLFEKRVQAEYIELCAEVRGYGLVRREYWRDLKKLRELKSPWANNANWRTLKEELDYDLPDALRTWGELQRAGLVKWKHVKCQNAARARMFEVCMGKNKPVPRTDKYDQAKSAVDECIAIDSDSCRLSEDVHLVAYAELTHCGKMLTADVPQLRKGVARDGVEHPIHTHYEVCLETGRISSAGPNVTNRARGEGKERKLRDGTVAKGRYGDRECFTCRAGNVLIDSDYPSLELFALAQVCKWVLGYSTLGEVLVSKDENNPHIAFAAKIAGIDYATAAKRKKDDALPEYDAAKGTNFGVPGGLGAETMVSYAAKSYGVIKTKDEWVELIALWKEQWPEMPAYFAFINSLEYAEGEFAIAQAWSGRLRAGATYCAAANSWFQGLGADCAKLAGWYVFKACYVPGIDPGLYGCMPVNFIHDQLMVEAPEARAAEAAKRVEYWMGKAAREVMPDYGGAMADRLEAVLCKRWSKMAKKVVDGSGTLVAWEDPRLVEALDAADDCDD